MKSIFTFLAICLFTTTAFSQKTSQDIPIQNAKVITYVKKMKGKKVDRGECWDLLSYALNETGAVWDAPENFGKEVDYTKSKIYPGDMIYFKNVRVDNPDGSWQTFPHHYAVVYEVKGKGEYVIAHQNVDNVRKVIFADFNTNNKTKGKLVFYRPQGE